MSDANRLQLNELVKDINNNIVAEIAVSRNIDPTKLMEISSKMLVTDTRKAKQYNLVDSLLYYDQVLAEFKNRVGVEKESDLNFIKYNKYKKSFTASSTGKNEIAVIVAEGDIMPGKAQKGTIGSNTFAAEIRKATDIMNKTPPTRNSTALATKSDRVSTLDASHAWS